MSTIRSLPSRLALWGVVLLAAVLCHRATAATPVVPGSGQRVTQIGDDFEDPNWNFNYHHPKSSRNINKRENGPLGASDNQRWLEGPHRGTPDVMQRVPTPVGGLTGSEGSVLIRSIRPGIPNQITYKTQQDDIMVQVKRRLGQPVPVSALPNCVVRVYVPPFDQWEDRSGASFGFRCDCWGRKPGQRKLEQYWPGIFLNFRSATDKNVAEDVAYLTIRSDQYGRDIRGPAVTPGWWTMGLSVSADGMCHFYAKPGIDNLTAADHLASYYPYGFRAERFDLFFFNVLTMDNGKTWSTPWIIDDPQFFTGTTVTRLAQPTAPRRRFR